MDEKLDELLQSINNLRSTQQQNQWDITAKLDRLEHDVETGQEETLQLVAKKLKQDTGFQFRRKGNAKQHSFNKGVNDYIQSTASVLEKIKPTAVHMRQQPSRL